MKKVSGVAFCGRCQRTTEYHLSGTRLYGVTLIDGVCNECDYVIQSARSQGTDAP